MSANEISVGLAAKLSDAIVGVGATREIVNHLAEHPDLLVDAITHAKLKIEQSRRLQFLESVRINKAEIAKMDVAFGELSLSTMRLMMSNEFQRRLKKVSQGANPGTLTATKLLHPANYKHIKKHLTPTTTYAHLYQFVRKQIDEFNGSRMEKHVFLVAAPAEFHPLAGTDLVQPAVRVHLDDNGILVDLVYLDEDYFFGNGTIVHSFTRD